MIAVIAGIAAHGRVNFIDVGASVAGTLIFLAFSLTMGRSLVARLIRWSSDHMTTEVPVITVILLVVLVMTLSTETHRRSYGAQSLRGRHAGWAVTDFDRAYRRPAPRPYHCALQHDRLQRLAETFHGPLAIVLNRTGQAASPARRCTHRWDASCGTDH
jgi:hypothetical protein